MNIIFGVIFFVIAFMAGVALPPAVVGDVMPNGPAASVMPAGHPDNEAYRGLKPGDRIVRIDGQEITDFGQVQIAAGLAGRGQTIDVTIQRQGVDEPLTYRLTPTLMPGGKLLSIGIASPASLRLFEDAELPPELVAAGVKGGMSVVAVDGKPVQRIDQYEQIITDAAGREVPVTFSDGQKQVTAPVSAQAALVYQENIAQLLGLVAPTQIAGTALDSPAEAAGLRRGDLLAQVGSVSWPSPEQVSGIVTAAGGKPVPLAVEREGALVKLDPITPGRDGKLGILPAPAVQTNRIAHGPGGRTDRHLRRPATPARRRAGHRQAAGGSGLRGEPVGQAAGHDDADDQRRPGRRGDVGRLARTAARV
jgi:membrane-associated protease RseP (regulator of RpoE activity)